VTVGAEWPESRQRNPSDGHFEEKDLAMLVPGRRSASNVAREIEGLLIARGFVVVGYSSGSRDIDNCAVLVNSPTRSPTHRPGRRAGKRRK
jgi:hypothetical protein